MNRWQKRAAARATAGAAEEGPAAEGGDDDDDEGFWDEPVGGVAVLAPAAPCVSQAAPAPARTPPAQTPAEEQPPEPKQQEPAGYTRVFRPKQPSGRPKEAEQSNGWHSGGRSWDEEQSNGWRGSNWQSGGWQSSGWQSGDWESERAPRQPGRGHQQPLRVQQRPAPAAAEPPKPAEPAKQAPAPAAPRPVAELPTASPSAATLEARAQEMGVLEAIYGSEFRVGGDAEWFLDLPGPLGTAPATLQLLLPDGYPQGEEAPVPIVHSDSRSDAVQAAAAEAVQELLAEWQPSEEGCVYQWAERLREAVGPILEEAADAALAMEAQREEIAAAAEERREIAQVEKGFNFVPANPQYGQRRRNFDERAFDEGNKVQVKQGEPITDRKSTFQAFAAQVSSAGQVQWLLRTLLSDRKIAVATHNIFAYRFTDEARGVLIADNDDDGEDSAGTKLAELLSLAGCEGVFVMVSRWYGGIQLGPDRFKHICRAASTLLDSEGWSRRGGRPANASAAAKKGAAGKK